MKVHISPITGDITVQIAVGEMTLDEKRLLLETLLKDNELEAELREYLTQKERAEAGRLS